MKRRWIGLIVAGGLVAASFGSAVNAFAATSTGADPGFGIVTGYDLELTGTTPYESGMRKSYDSLVNGNQIVFENGTYSDELVDFDEYGEYYALRTKSYDEEVNATGFFSADGEQLIPYEAAFVKWVSIKVGEGEKYFPHRYLSVVYSDGVAEDESEAYFYLTASYLSLSPGEDDVLYKGHEKIYDTVTRQFVPNIELTDPSFDVYECGDAIVIDRNGAITMYDANGKELLSSEDGTYNSGYNHVGNGILILKSGQKYKVYDDTGKQLFESDEDMTVVESVRGYVKQYDSGLYTIFDSSGKQVLDQKFKTVYEESGSYLSVETDKEAAQLVSLDGKVIAENDDIFNFYTYSYGFVTEEKDETYSLYGPSGLLDEGLTSASPYLIYTYNDGSFLALNTGEKIAIEPGTSFADSIGVVGLLLVHDDTSGLYGLYDAFTGEQLLDCSYRFLSASATHVYAMKDDTWEIYSLNPIFSK